MGVLLSQCLLSTYYGLGFARFPCPDHRGRSGWKSGEGPGGQTPAGVATRPFEGQGPEACVLGPDWWGKTGVESQASGSLWAGPSSDPVTPPGHFRHTY